MTANGGVTQGDGEAESVLDRIRRVLVDLRFAEVVREESRRLVLCRPEDAGRLRWQADQAGVSELLDIRESPFVPPGQMYVIDVQALEANTREALATWRWRG